MVKLFVVKQLFQTSELNVHSGEWITITGKNGTGKTTRRINDATYKI